MITAADTGDRAAAQFLLEQVADAHHRWAPWFWADGGCTGSLVEYRLAGRRRPQPRPRTRSSGTGHRSNAHDSPIRAWTQYPTKVA